MIFEHMYNQLTSTSDDEVDVDEDDGDGDGVALRRDAARFELTISGHEYEDD